MVHVSNLDRIIYSVGILSYSRGILLVFLHLNISVCLLSCPMIFVVFALVLSSCHHVVRYDLVLCHTKYSNVTIPYLLGICL